MDLAADRKYLRSLMHAKLFIKQSNQIVMYNMDFVIRWNYLRWANTCANQTLHHKAKHLI